MNNSHIENIGSGGSSPATQEVRITVKPAEMMVPKSSSSRLGLIALMGILLLGTMAWLFVPTGTCGARRRMAGCGVEDDNALWKVGSLIQVFSNSNDAWCEGVIVSLPKKKRQNIKIC